MAAVAGSGSRAPRLAAKNASTMFEAQLMSSPIKQDAIVTPAKSVKRSKSRSQLKKAPSASASRVPVSAPIQKASPRSSSRKRPISLNSGKSDDEESDLTSLSTHGASSPPPRAKPTAQRPRMEPPPLGSDGNFVWVLLDFTGRVLGLDDEDDGVERIWWPGEAFQTPGNDFQVRLCGEIGALGPRAVVDVDAPVFEGNLHTFCNASDEIRFTDPAYLISSPRKNGTSPQKRQKLDRTNVEQQWRLALSEVVHEYDGVPTIAYMRSIKGIPPHIPSSSTQPANKAPDNGKGQGRGKGKGKGKGKALSDDELSEAQSPPPRWSPPPVDPSLEIPGELIIAREKPMDKRHWPAKILESVVPLAPGPMLYSIQWMDNTKGTIPREQFYTYEEEGFGLCEIGKFESVFNEVVNDTDDDRPAPPRSTRLSPEPHNPPPTADVFCDLPVHDQFVHTKPVLQAILRDEYPPARVAHTKFIGGGNGRNDIVKNAGERGLLDPRDVSEFLVCLKEWCLRGMEMDKRAVEEEEEQAETKKIVAEVLKLEDDVVVEGAEQLDAGLGQEVVLERPKHDVSAEVDEPATDSGMGIGNAIAVDSDISPPLENTGGPNPDNVAIMQKDDDLMRDAEVDTDLALQETLCAPASPTATVLDETPSSPALPPPSSSFSPDTDVPMETEEIEMTEERAPSQAAVAPAMDTEDDVGNLFDTSSTLSEASDISDLVRHQKPGRQIGCPAYEGLSTVEKMDYCLNVLLPELLGQICLWRIGRRTSVALLSPEEELELHQAGKEEKRKTDWVFDVKRMRAQKEKELGKGDKSAGGSKSRLRRKR